MLAMDRSKVPRLTNNIALALARERMLDFKELQAVVKEEMDRCAAEYTPRPRQFPKPIQQIMQELSASDDPNKMKELIEQLDLKIMLNAQAGLHAIEAKVRDVVHKHGQLLGTLVNGRRPSDGEDDDEGNGDEDCDDEDENSGGEGDGGNEE